MAETVTVKPLMGLETGKRTVESSSLGTFSSVTTLDFENPIPISSETDVT